MATRPAKDRSRAIPQRRESESRSASHARAGWALALLAAAGLAVYANSFNEPFVFDGAGLVRDSPLIRSAWPPWPILRNTTRPVAMLTFAVNHAIGGTELWGYHAVNLAIHVAAAWVLFDLVRRTLGAGRLAARYAQAAWGLALGAALIWLVHPLQTQSVTYLYQRYESLMGLFYLLTLYCFVRAQGSRHAIVWGVASLMSCLLAVGTKEVAVTAPVLVLWYDRVFVATSWQEIWSKRRAYYGSFVLAFGLLALIMVTHWGFYPGGGVLVVEGVSPWDYAISQPGVILHYLRLAIWPAGQCFDYGWPVARTPWEIVPPLAVIGLMIGGVVGCMFRRPELGFLGAWFFLILAPTSSVAPIVDLAFEHRMYLSLAAVAVLAVIGLYELTEQNRVAAEWTPRGRQTFRAVVLAVAVVALGAAAHQRNEVYRSETTLWADVVRKAPHHARGHYNLAHALETDGDYAKAIGHYRRAVELNPNDATSHNNLANLLAEVEGDLTSAIRHYRRALEIDPPYASAYDNLGKALARTGDVAGAIVECRKALEVRPDYAPAHVHLATLLAAGRPEEALAHARHAVEMAPRSAEAHNALASLLAATRPDDALRHYQTALEIEPGCPDAHFNMANLLVGRGRVAEAIAHLREALRARPDWELAANNLRVLTGAVRESPRTSAPDASSRETPR